MGRKGYQRMCEKCVFFFSIVILYLTLNNYFSLFYHICARLTYNSNVRLKLHPMALHTGSEPTRIINVPEVSFKQLCATKINLLLGKLPVSLIPHYPPALVIQERWKWILAKGSRKPARCTGGNVFIQPCLSTAFPWTAVGLSGWNVLCWQWQGQLKS